jgi:integrase
MPLHKLTAAQIAAAKPGDKPYNLGDGAGLELVVQPSGSKNWILRYTFAGKRREMGLGSYSTLDLKAARAKAQKQRQLLLEGKDPLVERRKARIENARRGKLFAIAVEEYVTLHAEEWKWPRQAAHWRSQIARYANPTLGALPVDAIDTPLVLAVLEPIWRTKSGVARTLRGRLESIFDWAIHKGYSSQANPARWKRHLEYSLPDLAKIRPVKNARSLSFREIGPFILAVRRSSGVAALALDFLVLTGARTTEVSDMEWKELDDRGIWILPPRVKGRREGDGKRDHLVPLSRQAVSIIEAMRHTPDYNGRYVFPGTARGPGDRLGRSMSAWSMLSLIKRLGYHDRLVTHGLRTVLNSWALDQGVPTEPRKMLLSHTVGDAIDEVYRGTEMVELRRRYSQQWADFVDAEVAHAAVEASRARSMLANKVGRPLEAPAPTE